ncbi:MAG: phage tail sheath family protein [Planctomycetota bacterium]
MTTYQTPGVYVVEDDTVPIVLTGAPTGIPCFFGFTDQGPSAKPTRLASLNEFYSVFGKKANSAVFPNQYLADAVHGFFMNGGNVCYVCRVNEGDTAMWPVNWIQDVADYVAISDELRPAVTEGNPTFVQFLVKAISPGTWGNRIKILCEKADDSGLPPLHTTKDVKIKKDAAKPAKAITLDELQPAGNLGVPEAGILDTQPGVELDLNGVKMAWKNGGFAGGSIPREQEQGEIVIPNPLNKDKPVIVPVIFNPDNRLDPSNLEIPGEKVEELVEGWDFRTSLTFLLEDDTGNPMPLRANWSKEAKAFFITQRNGEGFPLKGFEMAEDCSSTLTSPVQLPPGMSLHFDLTVQQIVPGRAPGDPPTAQTLEKFSGLSTNPEDPRYYLRDDIVNGMSSYVTLAKFDSSIKKPIGFGEQGKYVLPPVKAGEYTEIPLHSPQGADHADEAKGSDKQPPPTDYSKFFDLLKGYPEVSIIACPDAYPRADSTPESTYQTIYQSAQAYAEAHRCMVVIDPPPMNPELVRSDAAGMTAEASRLKQFADKYRSSYVAIYAPWVTTANLDATAHSRTKLVPPSGLIIGAYNKSDAADGVWKAPANMPLLGPIDLQYSFTDEQNDVLNPAGVNPIRTFPGYGILIWGARTTSREVMWQYVNVRRIFLYVERTLKQQMMAAVFESNDHKTWTSITLTVESFLREFWQEGGLMGTSEAEAFRVQCGVPQTMTMQDVDAGLLKVEISIAPVRPAEFVVFTISQLVQTAASGS